MRTCDEIDAELRLLATVRQSIRGRTSEPSSQRGDDDLLLDERAMASGG
jgi:hypothetical protein